METFTLAEARELLGQTIIATQDFDGADTRLAVGDRGTVIGITAEPTPRGDPRVIIAVQFWLDAADPPTLPHILFVSKVMLQHLFTRE